MFSGPCDSKNLNNDNKYRKIRKKLQFLSKNVKIRDGKKLKNHSITTRNYAVFNYQNLEEVSWHLGLKKLKN